MPEYKKLPDRPLPIGTCVKIQHPNVTKPMIAYTTSRGRNFYGQTEYQVIIHKEYNPGIFRDGVDEMTININVRGILEVDPDFYDEGRIERLTELCDLALDLDQPDLFKFYSGALKHARSKTAKNP